MKRIEAIFRPERLAEVHSAMDTLEHAGLTVIEVKGHGVQGGLTQHWRGEEYHISLVPKVMVLAVVDDHEVQDVIETISSVARTGVMGDGKIFVSTVEQAIRIRTGETGHNAI